MASGNALGELREYLRTKEGPVADASFTEGELDNYSSRLNKSLQSLQNQVTQHANHLDSLRGQVTEPSVDEPSPDLRLRLQQIRTATAAYRRIIPTDPALPYAESPLPALLAVRSTLKLTGRSKIAISDTNRKLVNAQNELRREDQSLKEAQHLTSALQARITKLRYDEAEQATKSAPEIASKLVLEQQQRKLHFAKELRGLIRALNKFVSDHLAVMLAAEDLGGPVVGDAFDLTEESLRGGFTQQGKAKKVSAESESSEKKRLQRNEQIWGTDSVVGDEVEVVNEKDAAAAAFRNLTESLLNADAKAKAEGASPYVLIAKENAAVRFLLRLLNFGATMEYE